MKKRSARVSFIWVIFQTSKAKYELGPPHIFSYVFGGNKRLLSTAGVFFLKSHFIF